MICNNTFIHWYFSLSFYKRWQIYSWTISLIRVIGFVHRVISNKYFIIIKLIILLLIIIIQQVINPFRDTHDKPGISI